MHVSSHDYEFAAALVAAALSLRPATSRNWAYPPAYP